MNHLTSLLEIIRNLSPFFWISTFLISPIFSFLEKVIQDLITKILYYFTNIIQLKNNRFLRKVGFLSSLKLNHLQELHKPYENQKSISEKLKISEDFLDETRGGMFLLNDLSEEVFGPIVDEKSSNSDYYYFNRELILKQDYSINELESIKKGIKISVENNTVFYTNPLIFQKVNRTPLKNIDLEFQEKIKQKFKIIESDFLENVEMYLFQKRINRKWRIFKVIAFIPFMLFLSELIEVIFGILFDSTFS